MINIQEWWQSTPQRTRLGFMTGLLLILLFAGYALYWLFRSDYQVLFTDLAAQDAAALVKELDKLKTPYELSNGGTSILVPSDVVYKTRLKLMGQNIPLQGGVGFEIFNNSDFGMTEFAQKVNYQRALQGELTRTIMGIEEVKFARVHIVMAESGLFKKNKVKPKASVTLIMKPDAALRPDQVVGIQRLVAASVPEIEPSAVTILDQQGVALSRNSRGSSETNGATETLGLNDSISQQLEIKKEAEAHLTHKLAEVLDKALGTNQAIVSVDISLNYDLIKVTKENVLGAPGKNGQTSGVVIRKRNSMRGQTLPVNESKTIKSEGTSSDVMPTENSSSEIDYQTGRQVEQVISTPGSIRRISVGILVPNYQAEEKLSKISKVLQMAAGINSERGDALVIYSLDEVIAQRMDTGIAPSSSKPADPSQIAVQPTQNPANSYLRYLLFLLGMIFIGALIYRFRSKRLSRPTPPLSMIEREQLLRDIQSWLGSSGNPESSRGTP